MDSLKLEVGEIKRTLETKLTKSKLEKYSHDFEEPQKIIGSEVLTYNSLPTNSQIIENENNFFGTSWVDGENITINAIACSYSKYSTI